MKGRFIVLEGPDGSGTTTHAALLAEALQREGRDVLLTMEPSDGPIGRSIRDILQGNTLPSAEGVQLLFTADRASHVADVIRPALEAGKVVVCDRYAPSTVAYGSALGLDSAWLSNLNSVFPQPDATFLLLPPLEVCLERMMKRKSQDLFEERAFQQKVHTAYEDIADRKSTRLNSSHIQKSRMPSSA